MDSELFVAVRTCTEQGTESFNGSTEYVQKVKEHDEKEEKLNEDIRNFEREILALQNEKLLNRREKNNLQTEYSNYKLEYKVLSTNPMVPQVMHFLTRESADNSYNQLAPLVDKGKDNCGFAMESVRLIDLNSGIVLKEKSMGETA